MSTTMAEFLKKIPRLRATFVYGAEPPDDPDWKPAHSWTVTFNFQRRAMTVPFYCGAACGEPTMREVLSCLRSDAWSIRNARGFQEWCDEFGYDPDSRRAERIYKACERQSERLERLLGEHFDAFMEAEDDT